MAPDVSQPADARAEKEEACSAADVEKPAGCLAQEDDRGLSNCLGHLVVADAVALAELRNGNGAASMFTLERLVRG